MDFFGIFEHKTDKKGRVSFPAPWRKKINLLKLILTENFKDNNWLLFPKECWKKLTKKEKEKFKIWIELKIDSHGRLYLPLEFKKIFKFSKQGSKIIFQGRENKIVLWTKKNWGRHLNLKNCL